MTLDIVALGACIVILIVLYLFISRQEAINKSIEVHLNELTNKENAMGDSLKETRDFAQNLSNVYNNHLEKCHNLKFGEKL
jgi:hypothetical protein